MSDSTPLPRFDLIGTLDGGGPAEAIAASDGEWVRYEDARAAVADAVQRARADTLLQVIQRLSQNPYSLTKSECIAVVQAMRVAIRATPDTPGTESK